MRRAGPMCHRHNVAAHLPGDSGEIYEGDRFVRLRWLRHLLESGRLDRSLHWSDGAEVSE